MDTFLLLYMLSYLKNVANVFVGKKNLNALIGNSFSQVLTATRDVVTEILEDLKKKGAFRVLHHSEG